MRLCPFSISDQQNSRRKLRLFSRFESIETHPAVYVKINALHKAR